MPLRETIDPIRKEHRDDAKGLVVGQYVPPPISADHL